MATASRQAALDALLRVERDSSYSNITLDHIFRSEKLPVRERPFAALLFYGVLEKKLLLDYNLARFSDRRIDELDDSVLNILRMGLYQLYFADSVPASAAVNESVELCRTVGAAKAAGYVNAVLRAASAQAEPLLPEKRRGKNKYFSILYSCPETLIRLWRDSYGDELTEQILRSLDGRPPVSARVNTLKTTAEKLTGSLAKSGVRAERSELSEDALSLYGTGSVEELEEYRQGLFHIQDEASQLCCRMLEPEPGQTMIDACSAPGGKAFTTAQMMKNSGRIIACDLYEQRLGLVKSGARRLGIDIITTCAGDSAKIEGLPEADRILCDVPCSGLGIIRRKPELRYKNDTGTEVLPEIQYSILSACAAHLKSGGVLVYSTCTLNPAENGMVIRRFLEENKGFEPYPMTLPEGISRRTEEPENELTLFPQPGGTDGFFISRIRRK